RSTTRTTPSTCTTARARSSSSPPPWSTRARGWSRPSSGRYEMLSRYRQTTRMWSDPLGRALFRLRLRPNHLTVMGLVVSLGAAAAFVMGQVRLGGLLVLIAGLFDFADGSLARASGQVTPFGGFLDSVIDRYSDLVVLLGIVVLFAGMPNMRGALVAMAGVVGSVMVSYTKARAESIGVECRVGMMERPERLLCL